MPTRTGGAHSEPCCFFAAVDKPDTLALLLRRGAPLDTEVTNGETALVRAVWNEQWHHVALLLQTGADVGHVSAVGTRLAKAVAFVSYRAGITGQPVPPEVQGLEARLQDRLAD